MTHPLIELGGQGPPVVLVPANGFPPETYRPALEPLFSRNRVVCLPPRALWPAQGPPPTHAGSWTMLADDLLDGVTRHKLAPVIAVGHSFGAVAALLAAVRDRIRFRALAMLDPTIMPPAVMEGIRGQQQRGETAARALAQGARKRRDRFAGEAEAFDYWRGKPLFRDWSDDAVLRYTRAMLRPAQDGGFTLAWPAAWEAYYYDSFYAGTWTDVARLDQSLPVLVAGGAESDTFLPEAAALFRERLPRATHVTIPGRGHLFPQAAPAETGRLLTQWLAGISSAGA